MSALGLEGPPQNIPALGAEVLDLQLGPQELLRKPGLVHVQRAGGSRVCCCGHVKSHICAGAQSLEKGERETALLRAGTEPSLRRNQQQAGLALSLPRALSAPYRQKRWKKRKVFPFNAAGN